MSDDFDDLRALMDQATPAPDPDKKAAHLALARENFATLQENTATARQTSDRPETGIIRGVKTMFAHLTTRGAMTATTALVAFGVIVAWPQLMQMPGGLPGLEPHEAPLVASKSTAPDDADTATLAAKPMAETSDLSATDELTNRSEPPQTLSRAAPPPQQRRAASDGLLGGVVPQSAPAPAFMPAPDTASASQHTTNTEAFATADQNPLKITSENPVSTFSVDVDTASYAILRSSITSGAMPVRDAVRIEEMINYFPYGYPAPDADGAPFKPTVTVTPTPWNGGTNLVHIAIQGQQAQTENRPPLNLVFLIDTSGSMKQANKLPLLKQSLALMLPQLTANDQISIVTYAGSAGQVLAPTPATDRAAILTALDNLQAGGSTAGQAGLQQAYGVAQDMAEDGEVTRVILATDGDFNVGLSDPQTLRDFIAEKRETGTYLSVMGFGRGNLDDATMQALAQNGNGQASYVDTLSEAQKVLVDQASGALFPIANDVKIQVEFNPAHVAEYRLIGYETRHLNREDFNNDKVDAGDIGAGHTVTAIYEITPTGSPARLSDPLRYDQNAVASDPSVELGFLKLRYKEPGQSTSRLIETPILPGMGGATDDTRFGIAIAGFGELLRGGAFTGDWGYSQAITMATAARGDDPFGYRAEAITLMRLANSLSR